MIRMEYPEVKLAGRVIEKYNLTPPIDVKALLESYNAIVTFEQIPISGVDGIAFDIKVAGKRPSIIINQHSPTTRQNFTMAHELGHLLIPWHTGIRVDRENADISSEIAYSIIEEEANRFASALLMPTLYVKDVLSQCQTLSEAHSRICQQLTISPIAAAKRMVQMLPADIMYCAVRNGLIEYSGRSEYTTGQVGSVGDPFTEGYSPFPVTHSEWLSGSSLIHWWKKTEVNLPLPIRYLMNENEDERPLSAILNTIVEEINPDIGAENYKHSLNGAIGSVKNKMRARGIEENVENLVTGCYERLTAAPYEKFGEHPDFGLFLVKKSQAILKKGKRTKN